MIPNTKIKLQNLIIEPLKCYKSGAFVSLRLNCFSNNFTLKILLTKRIILFSIICELHTGLCHELYRQYLLDKVQSILAFHVHLIIEMDEQMRIMDTSICYKFSNSFEHFNFLSQKIWYLSKVKVSLSVMQENLSDHMHFPM